jgi:hypothetical protein
MQMKSSSCSRAVVLQIDFAENFTCQYQDETSAAHWLQSHVSIFTACLWNGNATPSSFVIASDKTVHDKTAVTANIVQLLKFYLSNNPSFQNLHIFSDGPASQMKNRFMYAVIAKIRSCFHLSLVTWSFFATSHGKGPIDAVGGMAKRLVWQSILSRRVDAVRNAHEFIEVLKSSSSTIQALLSAPLDETSALEYINATDELTKAPQVPNISKDHFWRCDEMGSSRSRLSRIYDCQPSVSFHDYELVTLPQLSTTSNALVPNVPDIDLTSHNINDLTLQAVVLETQTQLNDEPATKASLEEMPPPTLCFIPGTIVKCTVIGQRRRHQVDLGEVVQQIQDSVQIKYLRRRYRGIYSFPEVDNFSWEPVQNVSAIPQPTKDRRHHFVFTNDPLP